MSGQEAQSPLSAKDRLFSLLFRFTPTERQRVLVLTIVCGGLCGLAAVSFHLGIGKSESLIINRALAAPGPMWIYLGILVPAIGGLISGLALHYWIPGAVGSGIPQVKYAYAMHAGHIPWRDAIGKYFLGIIQLGSGASLGREGPTVQICAGISSLLARVASLSRQSQRRMTSVGVAAGIAAAFNAPIAAVAFTLEEIIGDLDQTMLAGVIVAAAIAAAVERSILGQHPVFEVHRSYIVDSASSFVSYVILGLFCGVISVILTDSMLGLRAWFKRFTAVPKWMHPAMGGALTGAVAVIAILSLKQNGITGAGYRTLSLALAASLPAKVMMVLCVLKIASTVFSYSSGGVGGLFAPVLFMGGMMGGVIGYGDVAMFHHASEAIAAFALVGMGAFFAATIRAPMTSVLIIFEMTGGYSLILPLMIANMSAYALARHWRHTPIYEALSEQDGTVLPHGKPVTPPPSAPELPGEVPP